MTKARIPVARVSFCIHRYQACGSVVSDEAVTDREDSSWTYGPEALKVVEMNAVLANLLQDRGIVQRLVGSMDGGVAGTSG